MSQSVATDLFARGSAGDLDDIGSRGRTSVYAADGLVLKVFLTESDKPDREVAGLEVAAMCDLRVPAMLWSGVIAGRRSVLLERLSGTQPEPRSDLEWVALARAIGAVAQALHRPVPAFGAWTASPYQTAGKLLTARVERNAALARSQPNIDRSLLRRSQAWLARRAEDLDVQPPLLVHRDLSDRNVFGVYEIDEWNLSAVIDFESCGGGLREEEARWSALLERGGLRPPGTLDAFTSGLDIGLDPDILDVFVVDLAIDVMSYAGHRNPALMRAAISAARGILDG